VRGGSKAVHTWDIPDVFGETTSTEKLTLKTILYLRRRLRKRNWGDADPISIKDLENSMNMNVEELVASLKSKNYIREVGDMLDLKNTFNGKYRRLHWDEPASTVDTRFGSPRLFLHPDEDRAYTVREAARLQGFPDSFIFYGPIHAQYKMIGNAVPPPLGEYISEVIKNLYE
jgi:DNA (cytosine-5)-methyltransferase 1